MAAMADVNSKPADATGQRKIERIALILLTMTNTYPDDFPSVRAEMLALGLLDDNGNITDKGKLIASSMLSVALELLK